MNDPFPSEPIAFYSGKKICVTGATGLIGSYAVKLLLDSGAKVRQILGKTRPIRYISLSVHGDETPKLDLMNPKDAVSAVSGCDIVIGCAGITGGIGLAHSDPLGYVGPATVIAINTLHACVQQKVERFGFLSSTTVYPPYDFPVREELTCWPDDESALNAHPYPLYKGIGESKRFLEKLCAYYAEKTGIKIGIVRPSGAYGRFDNFNESSSHVIPGLLNRALRLEAGQPFEVWGDGNDVRDFVHAQDVVRGLLLAVAHGETTSYNIASGNGVSTYELAEAIRTVLGGRYEIVTNPAKPTALRYRVASIEKARKELGFEPQIKLVDGLRDTIEWLKEQRA